MLPVEEEVKLDDERCRVRRGQATRERADGSECSDELHFWLESELEGSRGENERVRSFREGCDVMGGAIYEIAIFCRGVRSGLTVHVVSLSVFVATKKEGLTVESRPGTRMSDRSTISIRNLYLGARQCRLGSEDLIKGWAVVLSNIFLGKLASYVTNESDCESHPAHPQDFYLSTKPGFRLTGRVLRHGARPVLSLLSAAKRAEQKEFYFSGLVC